MSTTPTGTLLLRQTDDLVTLNDRMRRIGMSLDKVKDFKYVDINQQLLHCWGDSGLTS